MKIRIISGLFLCLLLVSCFFENDNEDFSFKIIVKDTSGNPVEGLNVSLLNKIDCPFWEEMELTNRANGTIVLTAGSDCFAELYIEDIDRNQIRTLFDGNLEAGYHHFIWNGTDDNDNPMPCGVYYSRTVLTQSDTVLFAAERMMYLLSLSPEHKQGSTNQAGEFICESKNPFINLINADDLEIVDENSEILGMESFSNLTAIYLSDSEDSQIFQITDRKVKDKANLYYITWDPENSRRFPTNRSLNSSDQIAPRDLENRIVIPSLEDITSYPNPFN